MTEQTSKAAPAHGLIQPVDLPVYQLPDRLEGLKICQITDLHTRRHRRMYDRLCEQLNPLKPDLLALTGDLPAHPGREKAARQAVAQIIEAADPALATLCVFGNHDHESIRQSLADLPIRQLIDDCWRTDDLPLDVLGVNCSPENFFGDLFGAMGKAGPFDGEKRVRVLLAHMPTWLIPAGDMGIDLMLSGHTHGGQMRLPGIWPIYVGNHWLRRYASGVFQFKRCTGMICRGLGEQKIDGLRLFCPPQALLVTLRKSDQPLESSDHIHVIQRW